MKVRLLALVLAVATVTCREASGPEGLPGLESLTLDVLVGADLEPGASATYVFRSRTALGVEVSLTARSGSVVAVVRDSASGADLTVIRASSSAPRGPSAKGTPVQAGPSHPLLVTVTAGGSEAASFTALISRSSAVPETRAARFAIGDTVRETHSGHGDVDVFTFDAATDGLEVLLAGRLVEATEWLKGTLRQESTGVQVASFWFADYTTGELDLGTVGPFTLPSAGRYTLAVSNGEDYAIADSALYEFQVRLLDRSPERLAATVAPGDSVDEAIDRVGDVDTFSLSAAPGTEVSFFLRSRGLRGRLHLLLEGTGIPRQEILATGAQDSVPLLRHTPRITLPAAGPYTLTVAGDIIPDIPTQGGYRLFVYPIRRAPESASSQLAERDTSVAERLELPEDIDEFAFTLAAPAYVHAALLRADSGDEPLRMVLARSGSDAVIEEAALEYSAENRRGIATTPLPAGEYTLRVHSWGENVLPYLGAYRVVWTTVDDGPEGRQAAVAPAERVTGTLTPGDIDRFTFSGTAGARYDIGFGTEPANGVTGDLGLRVRPFGADGQWLGSVYGPASGTIPDTLRTYRFDLPVTGTYVIEVLPLEFGRQLDNVGSYHFTLRTYSALPEHTPVVIPVGTAVSDERVDELGDVDSLVVTGPPGQLIEVLVTGALNATVLLADDSSRHPSGGSFGRIEIPAGGGVPVVSSEQTYMVRDFGVVGFWQSWPFELSSYAIDPAPEGRTADVTPGDTVTGQIDVVGDVDVYTVVAAAGDTVRAVVGQRGSGDVSLTVRAPAGDVVASVRTPDCGGCGHAQADTWFIAPASGTYAVRLESVDDRFGTPGYWFLLTRR